MVSWMGEHVIPAVRNMKDFEVLMTSHHPTVILLEAHLSNLPGIVRLARRHEKKIVLHADLIQGLKHDEAATQFLCQMIRPDGLISTHASVISTAKRNSVMAIQRVFLIDSHSLKTSFRILTHSQPDFLEVLPGVLPNIITEIRSRTSTPILAGGFIRSTADIDAAIDAGATAVTTSRQELWDHRR